MPNHRKTTKRKTAKEKAAKTAKEKAAKTAKEKAAKTAKEKAAKTAKEKAAKTAKEKAAKKSSWPEKPTSQSPPKDSKQTAAEIIAHVEQPKEDVMSNGYGPKSPDHQSPRQEETFQSVLKALCNDTNDLQRRAIEEGALEDYNFSPEQRVAIVAVGHATGKYSMIPNAAGTYCCCCC